ncbi:hypothetical protein [Streptomyces sp. NPDC055642]
MTTLPEPTPTAPAAGQAATPLSDAVIRAAVENAIHESRRESTAPPVAQPGRPPMSSKAVDDTARMIGASVVIATTGGATTAVLWASGYANPTVVALVFGAPTVLVLAISRLLRTARPDPDVHNHYEGPVYQDQRNVENKNFGAWVKNTNE